MFSQIVLLISCAWFGCNASLVRMHMAGNSEDSTFMLVSGISAPEEMCLVAFGNAAGLDVCSSALAAADGRELWSFQSGGQLINVASKLCLSSSKAVLDEPVGLVACGSAGAWKLLPNGQVQGGEMCLSQAGLTSNSGNVALSSAASASSTLSAVGHGADAGVDSDAGSFWASKFDETQPVVFTLDMGEKQIVDQVSIAWEFPPLSFSVATSVDGLSWTEVFVTTANAVSFSRIPVGKREASWMKIVMRKPHPVYGSISGHTVYGISSLSVSALGMQSALADCSSASQSLDARDKYFASSVSEFDPAAAQALLSEIPVLDAAKASLSAVLAELASAEPALSACAGKVSLPSLGVTKTDSAMPHLSLHSVSGAEHLNSSLAVKSAAAVELAVLVDRLHGIDADGAQHLLDSAKALVRSIRHALV